MKQSSIFVPRFPLIRHRSSFIVHRSSFIVHSYFLLLFLLASCETNPVDYGLDRYYKEILTFTGENSFLSDEGKTILNVSEDKKPNYQPGDRVLLNYTLLPETTSGYDYTVRVNGTSKIPLGKLTLVDQKEIETAANEPIHLESVWLGSHYLNFQLYLNYKSEAHSIGLLVDSTLLAEDTIRIYFKHNSNNDPAGYPVHTFISFDLEEVLGKPKNSQAIAVAVNTDNYGQKAYQLIY
jgi:hypothetical protein